ncbi:hypothetical protein HMPREF9432_01615 [Selenomonas noxia F0398]|uniref:Ribonuclease M5 n=2 Tax=Selenomonas noxia TaxID=135083 RepID=A0ABN0DNU2_9FIRM|nr:hypothetical protein HMPREF9432_01615 [Selenomonas noxia F0398]
MDVAAVRRAVDADCIITDGFRLRSGAIRSIRAAYERRGIIILTDPDTVGERIRARLTEMFPRARHAFIPAEDATNANDGDIGVEQAAPDAVRAALAKVRTPMDEPTEIFTMRDMMASGLTGAEDAAARRARLGRRLGLGFASAKTFLRRLNTYGVTRAEFEAAREELG